MKLKFLTSLIALILTLSVLSSCGRKGDLDPAPDQKRPRFGGVSDEMKPNPELEKKIQKEHPIQRTKTKTK